MTKLTSATDLAISIMNNLKHYKIVPRSVIVKLDDCRARRIERWTSDHSGVISSWSPNIKQNRGRSDEATNSILSLIKIMEFRIILLVRTEFRDLFTGCFAALQLILSKSSAALPAPLSKALHQLLKMGHHRNDH